MIRANEQETLVLSELRNLRRYAFCLLGNRSLSDLAVQSGLNSLVSEIRAASGRNVSRLDLYRKVNGAVSAHAMRDKAVAGGLHGQVLGLPLHQRQIAMLYTVIGLPFGDIAAIMGLPESEVRQLYGETLLNLRRKPASVLIIEDEALIARELSQIVNKLGLLVAGMAKNMSEALRIAGAAKPQIILADYQLRQDETGVEVVRAVREQTSASVIYITAHPEIVEKQRDVKSDIVISKPFNPRSIERAVQKLMAA